MAEDQPNQTWCGKRVAALILTLSLAGLGVNAWAAGVGDRHLLYLLCSGVVLGLLYTVRGGSLPEVILSGSSINADDDPSNLSPKLYVPILLAVILAAAILYYIYA